MWFSTAFTGVILVPVTFVKNRPNKVDTLYQKRSNCENKSTHRVCSWNDFRSLDKNPLKPMVTSFEKKKILSAEESHKSPRHRQNMMSQLIIIPTFLRVSVWDPKRHVRRKGWESKVPSLLSCQFSLHFSISNLNYHQRPRKVSKEQPTVVW